MTQYLEGREIVIRRERTDWSFHLPDQHEVEFNDDNNVTLSTPAASTTFRLVGINTDDPEEAVVVIGEAVTWQGPGGVGEYVPEPTGYPLPEPQDEIKRLEARWTNAGGEWQDLPTFGHSEHEVHLREMRGAIRKLEQKPEGQ